VQVLKELKARFIKFSASDNFLLEAIEELADFDMLVNFGRMLMLLDPYLLGFISATTTANYFVVVQNLRMYFPSTVPIELKVNKVLAFFKRSVEVLCEVTNCESRASMERIDLESTNIFVIKNLPAMKENRNLIPVLLKDVTSAYFAFIRNKAIRSEN
jgi:hypothetical protein